MLGTNRHRSLAETFQTATERDHNKAAVHDTDAGEEVFSTENSPDHLVVNLAKPFQVHCKVIDR